MNFRVTFKENPFLIFLLLVGVLLAFVGFNQSNIVALLMGLAVSLLVVVIRLRFYVKITDDFLESQFLSVPKRIRWLEIQQVIQKMETGYWPSKLCGPFVYEFRGSETSVNINFKLFSRDCYQSVFARVKGTGQTNS